MYFAAGHEMEARSIEHGCPQCPQICVGIEGRAMQWKVQSAIPAEALGETPRPLTAGRPPSHHELRSCRWESDGLGYPRPSAQVWSRAYSWVSCPTSPNPWKWKACDAVGGTQPHEALQALRGSLKSTSGGFVHFVAVLYFGCSDSHC